jgi:hypothetical protein
VQDLPVLIVEDAGGAPPMPKKFSDLSAATRIANADLVAITQSGTSKKASSSLIPLPRNYIAGLITSNGTDADHDIDIAIGEARDTTDTDNLVLAASITKQLDAAWAVGDAAGGLDTGSIASDTLYALWLIRRSDTEVVDALFSASFTAPTMPANYDQKRLIGAVKTDSSANIIPYLQSGDYFTYVGKAGVTPPRDINDTTITDTTYETGTLASVPPSCLADIFGQLINTSSTSNLDGILWIRAKTASSWTGFPAFELQQTAGSFDQAGSRGNVLVDSSQQIEYAAAENTGSATVDIYVMGFTMLTRRDPQ